ncbi:MAG: PQQ-dependent sugar dehydrogenase, partial [Myxococcales bacterium]|nr:PQQ-dependent sugar dehydrogenase [Myxococcales bacterium]
IAVGPFLDGALPPRTPNSPGSSQWTTVPAFPNLDVTNTIVISSNPGDDRIYVGSQDGLIVAFDNRADVSASETFLDLRDRVAVVNEGGLFGLAFHPQFGEIGSPYQKSFYLYYSSHCPLDSSRDAADLSACDDSYPTDRVNGFFNVYLRLSRFEVYEGTTTGDPSSEQVLLNFRLYGPRHRGGGLAIRRDGYLYLAIGDQDRPESAQEIVGNFDGGTLRVALNTIDNGDGTWTCPVGSHQPRRTFDTVDETSGRHYCIPDSNPWLDPAGGLLEEYCAIGLRNPFRLGIDSVTDRVWVGDVGQSSREEVNVIECGNNYGWPFREGTIEGVRTEPSSYLGVLTDPVVEFTRSEATSIIGGYVYRGTRFPELYGRYLAGDYGTDGIWAITLDESTMTGSKTYLTDFAAGNLVTWGQDNAGEVFLGDIYGTGLIYALDRVGTPAPDAPSLLSETGALSNLAAAAPSAYWVPYAPNQPFWSDGASKSRFIALPTDGTRDTAAEQIGFSVTGDWTFPSGTVLMKQFELPLDEADPSVTTRLETRFMVLGDDDKWYGLTYRWRADQLEADLLTTDETASYTIRRADGGTRMQNWYFPSRLDCLSCHRQGSGGALGLKTHQLNGDFTYPSTGRTDNQIRSWNDLGMFSPPVGDTVIPTLLSAPAFADVAAPLQDRARSWLDANCSYCHRPGEVNAGFDARFTTSFADQGFLWTAVRDDLGNPGTVVIHPGDTILSAAWQRSAAVGPIAMPPLAKALPDQPAVDLLAEWIERLPSAEPNSPPALANPGDQNNGPGDAVALSLIATDDDGDALYFDAIGLPDGLSLNHDAGAISGTIGSAGTQTVTVSASDGPSVSVVSFEWRVAADTCGDGALNTGEQCDDGNLANGDGCTSSCMLEFCGDGLVNNAGTEACEPPGTATCTDDCAVRTPSCGDGFLTPPEECEDGNTANGDGCSSACTIEVPPECGDGNTDLG